MKFNAKSMLAAVPLVVGLSSSPAMAALSDLADTATSNENHLTIETLLDRYAGVTPGEYNLSGDEHESVLPSQQHSSFSRSNGPMSSYYTELGSESPVSVRESQGKAADGDARGPSDLSHVVHTSEGSLGSVASGISPSSGGSSGGGTTHTDGAIPPVNPPIVDPPVVVPVPAAVVLLGSGLAALAPLRRRVRVEVA
jgi:hypothetical protein